MNTKICWNWGSTPSGNSKLTLDEIGYYIRHFFVIKLSNLSVFIILIFSVFGFVRSWWKKIQENALHTHANYKVSFSFFKGCLDPCMNFSIFESFYDSLYNGSKLICHPCYKFSCWNICTDQIFAHVYRRFELSTL